MNAAIIDGKIIIETIKLKNWACEHVRLKRSWRKKMEKMKKNLKKIKKFRKNLEKF